MAKPKLRKNINPSYKTTDVFNNLDTDAKNIRLVNANLESIKTEQKKIIDLDTNAHTDLAEEINLINHVDSVVKKNNHNHVQYSQNVKHIEYINEETTRLTAEDEKLLNQINKLEASFFVASSALDEFSPDQIQNALNGSNDPISLQILELKKITSNFKMIAANRASVHNDLQNLGSNKSYYQCNLEASKIKCENSDKEANALKTDSKYIKAVERTSKVEKEIIASTNLTSQEIQKHDDLSAAYLSGLKARNNILNVDALTKSNKILQEGSDLLLSKIDKLTTIDSYLADPEFLKWQEYNFQCKNQEKIIDNYIKLLSNNENENKGFFSNIASNIKSFFTKPYYEKKLHEAEKKYAVCVESKQKYEQNNPTKDIPCQKKYDELVNFFSGGMPKEPNGVDVPVVQLRELVSTTVKGITEVQINIEEQKAKDTVLLNQQVKELNENLTDMSVNMMNAGIQPVKLEDSKFVKNQELPVENEQDEETNISQNDENIVPPQVLDATSSAPQKPSIQQSSDFSSFSEDDGVPVDDKDFNIESLEKFNREVAEHAKHNAELQQRDATAAATNVASVKPSQDDGVSNENNNMDDGSITL